MNAVISLAPAFVVLALLAAIGLWISSSTRKHPDSAVDDSVWAQALGSNPSSFNRLVLGAAKPLSRLPPIFEAGTSRQYAALSTLVSASGRWGASLEVFLSVQALALLVALTAVAVAWAAQLGGMEMFAVAGGGLLIAAFPYFKTREDASKRHNAISDNLPDFAEVLLMSLTAGQSVMQSLRFTASTPDIDGPVSQEVRNTLRLLDLQQISDKELFDLVGHRLGTPESLAFFNALAKAHLDGSKVVETIQSQAQSLRALQFQRARATAKKLPTKLMLISFLHLMLSIFILAFLPFIITMQSVS